jgi:hydroxyacylglutathione hydrolase
LQPKVIKNPVTVLYIESFTFNAFSENTYLLYNDEKQCWIIDPGMYEGEEESYLSDYIDKNGLKPQNIINTHTHLDHIFGINFLKNKYQLPFGMHEKDMPVLRNAGGAAMLFGFNFSNPPKADFFIKETEPLQLGGDTLEVRFAPGHSPGSIVFYYQPGGWVIGGDVLFNGSIGRTDLPGGNFDTLINSIRTQLFTLPDDTVVYSGHGPATTILQEKRYNPFLQ